MRHPLVYALPILVVVASINGITDTASAENVWVEPGLASRVLEITRARTKIVWAHQVAGQAKKWGSSSADFELMGFDAADGKKRVILPGPASYANPSITPDGSRIVFSDVPSRKVYVVDWNGKNKKAIADGFALCTWVDVKTGIQWVYAGEAEFHSPIYRYQLDNPEVKELVWSKVCSCSNGFQVSADGSHTGSEFPHPNAGVATLPNGSWQQYGRGCEGCIAPDNSYRFFHMGESAGHSGVMMYDRGGINKRMVAFNNYPGRGRQDSWNPRWSTDVRFLTVSSPNSGSMQEVYLGEFDENFTRVVRWVQISNRPGQDLCSHAWLDPGLGFRAGEVPLTVEIPTPPEGGEWEWDYGDGAKESAPAGRHTYRKAGQYRVTARRGDTVIKGSVHAYAAKAPSVAAVLFFDEAHLAVAFDEQVQLKDAKVSLKSGTPIKGLSLNPGGSRLLLELGGKIGNTDSVHIEGVYDMAQVPKPLEKNVFPIRRPAWPADRSNLVFLWENDKQPGFQYDANANEFTKVHMRIKSTARYGPFGEMLLEGGVILAVDAPGGVYDECRKTNQLTVEAVITPANVYQGWGEEPRSIISCGWGGRKDSVNFRLAQEREKLVFYLRQSAIENNRPRLSVKRTELCTLTDEAPNHVVVSYEPGKLACYLNGDAVVQTDAVNGTLAWNRPPAQNGLNFGGSKEWQYERPYWSVHGVPPTFPVWRGKLQGVAIYSRAIGAEEAADNFAAYEAIIKARPVAPRIKFRGKLAAKSKIPNPQNIAPYRDALVVYEYDVEKILGGEYDLKKIRVARWALVDAKPASIAHAGPGDPAELAVEPFADHPELEAEVVSDTLEEDYDLPLYVDTANGPAGEPRLTNIRIRPYEVWLPPGDKLQYRATALDQYRVPVDVPLKWSVTPGGRINAGVYYGGGSYLDHRTQKATGTIDDTGLFTSDGSLGVVTITAAGVDDPSVKATAHAAVDDYPSIAPQARVPLCIGANQGGSSPFVGDIDRIRIYGRALKKEEIAAHAAGKQLSYEGLVADWTFDEIRGGVFPNKAGEGLAGKIMGDVQHITDPDVAYIRLGKRGAFVQVAPDPRLNFSKSCTLEAWIRPKKTEGFVASQGVILDKSLGGAPAGFRLNANNGLSSKGMHGHEVAWLRAGYKYPPDSWTHVAAVYDANGVRKLFANGKLIGELKHRAQVVID